MRIGMLDPAGTGLGVALGLAELGHAVAYVPAEPWPGRPLGDTGRQALELQDHFLGGPAPAPALADTDLLVLWDGFADGLHALTGRRLLGAPFDPRHPFCATINPLAYPERLRRYLELAVQAPRTVVVDCSDHQGPRESAFESLTDATLLAREVARGDAGPWRPLPFLYQPVLLWLEYRQPRASWFIPAAKRHRPWDWVFCGTIDHERYGGRRRGLLNEMVQRWPDLKYAITAAGSRLVDVLRILQSTRSGLDLPGAGEICFRLHECLSLDVPILRPWKFTVNLPAANAAACRRDPAELAGAEPGEFRALYEQHYAPRVAAEALLAAAVSRIPASPAMLPT